MQNYWGYLYNKFTGIFTNGFDENFRDADKNIIKHSDFDKVDVIYLANRVSGHIKPNDLYDSWNLDTYCNLICFNPFSAKNTSNDIKKICDLLPNDNLKFEQLLKQRQIHSDKLRIPFDGMCVKEYVYDNYKLLLEAENYVHVFLL